MLLSSAAILSVYAAGYARTQSSAEQIAAQAVQPALVPTATATMRAAAQAPAAPQPAQATTYRDGTYVGTGHSRHGDIEATVVIQGGKIVSSEVTQCLTRYSCSRIDSLRAQVISRQGPPVNHVSGATDSSTAYGALSPRRCRRRPDWSSTERE